MTKIIPGILFAILNLVFAVGVSAAEEQNVWVTDDEEQIVISMAGITHALTDMDGAFDVSDLADGETRTFGEGEHQVTVTRDGDVVTIQHPAGEGDASRSVLCRVSDDDCKILHVDGDAAQTMVMVRKHHTCEGDDEDCDHLIADVTVEDGGPQILVRKVIRCDGDGNCEESESSSHSGIATAEAFVTVGAGEAGTMKNMIFVSDDGGGHAMMLKADGKVQLRCPEGDTTMFVDEEAADRGYLCPEHSVSLEKVDPKVHGTRTIRIETRDEFDDED